MIKYNLIMVLNQEKTKILMCHRSKKPYMGLYNLPGGKIEENESHLESAYRELLEETNISKHDITLIPFIDFKWHTFDMSMDVFIGRLKKEVTLVEEAHKLYWIDIYENFFDLTKYAGEGNIGHMIEIYKINKDIV